MVDVIAAIEIDPQLKVLAENGFRDLATPFFTTEKELARLQTVSGLSYREALRSDRHRAYRTGVAE